MKLSYNVIWVDDRNDEAPFKEMHKDLISFLEEEFFDVTLSICETLDEFNESLDKENDVDLIITDYSLGDQENGTMVIDAARKKFVYTEIFFYSANNELQTNPTLINNNRVTFHQLRSTGGYRELYTEITSLISYTLRTYNHIINVRGLVVSEASYLEKLMMTLLREYIDNTQPQEEAIAILFEKAKKVINEKTSKIDKWQKKNNYGELMSDPVLFSSFTRSEVIKSVCNKLGMPHDEYLDSFIDEVIKVRNVFAHSKLITEVDGNQYLDSKIDGEHVTFNSEKCRQVRKSLGKHKVAMQQLAQKILGQGGGEN